MAFSPSSIVDRSHPIWWRQPAAIVGLAVVALGTVAAAHYHALELTLSHYDARAHLVVARRIFDSLTPGWRQIGAVWLPLPHIIDLPLVATSWGYRTGLGAAAVSVIALATGMAALADLLYRRTHSFAVATMTPLAIALNPNVLYLASTPMTEPLLIGLACVAAWSVDRWADTDTPRARLAARTAIALLALTRYEGWLIGGTLVVWAMWMRRGAGLRRAAELAPALLLPIVAFLAMGWATTGAWFAGSGFFERDPTLYHQPRAVALQIWESTLALGARPWLYAGLAGTVMTTVAWFRSSRLASAALALIAAVALPAAAFYAGHPHRIRYMVVVVVALTAVSGLALGALPRRARMAAALVFLALGVVERPPLDTQAPMVTEAQWETPFRLERRIVTEYLRQHHDGTPILASMGSLGHYMQEASHAGFPLRTFLHEGNGDLWMSASDAPSRHVHWVLAEERAEGGDLVARRASEQPDYLEGFERAAEGGGLVLYRRVPKDPPEVRRTSPD